MLKNTIFIYCDGSYNSKKNVGAWSCVIFFGKKSYIHTGTCLNLTRGIHECELRAIVKALGKIKCFCKNKRILIYTDCQSLVQQFYKINSGTKLPKKLSIPCKSLWANIMTYNKYNLVFRWLTRKQNIAHCDAFLSMHKLVHALEAAEEAANGYTASAEYEAAAE